MSKQLHVPVRAEGPADLTVQIDAVHGYEYRRVLQDRVHAERAGREQHQQELARALEVPDEPLAGLPGNDAFDDLVDAVDLLVASDDLDPLLALTVSVTTERDSPSDVPQSRTAVLRDGRGNPLATATRYVLDEFLAFVSRFGWDHLWTQAGPENSTFRQLLLRRAL